MSKTNSEIRSELHEWLNRTFLGPLNVNEEGVADVEEIIEFSPKDLYTTGILYPQQESVEDIYLDTEEDYMETESGNEDFNNEAAKDEAHTKKQKLKTIDDDEEELRLTTEFNPSSIAISFLVPKNSIFSIHCHFGKYLNLKETKSSSFKRVHYEMKCSIETGSNGFSVKDLSIEGWKQIGSGNYLVFNSKDSSAKLKVVARGVSNNFSKSSTIVTISLINDRKVVKRETKKVASCLFQPKIKVSSDKGFDFLPDNTDLSSLTQEEVELKFLYRNYKNYGMGHGCSVNWTRQDDKIIIVESEILPNEEINGVDFDTMELQEIDDILFMKKLTDCNSDYSENFLKSKLHAFVDAYSGWIIQQKENSSNESFNSDFKSAAERLISNCESLRDRMKKGIELLDKPNVRRAFLDANKAMFYQRVMSDFSKHRLREGRVLSNNDSKDDELPEFDSIPYNSESGIVWKNGKYDPPKDNQESNWFMAKWRPFQLAFLLSQIEGVVDENSDDRNTVDLLWFATGGGKTEAYLGLIAFTIFYNRQKPNADDQGVNVMMRYTLRMLNKQQFSRANILICACEIIRSRNSETYGNMRISNGLWVGRSFTPNKHLGSKDFPGNIDLLQKYKNDIENKKPSIEGAYSPPVFSCPCCGNKLVKEKQGNDKKEDEVVGRWGYNQIKHKFKNKPFPTNENVTNPFYMHCTNTRCHFHIADSEFKLTKNNNSDFIDRTLPIYYVDEEIYEVRPTLLFSTVDKYAQLAWKKECFRLFNYDSELVRIAPPPSLIVQDELHLISSSLGTIYSLFEFVINELCIDRGIGPKVVGATATVRNAKQQCINIYNRTNYSQFPPSGINVDDSFYSRKKEKDEKARIYVGLMPTGFTATTAKLRLDSILIEGVNKIVNAPNEKLDNYYTLLAYFNTVKELGKYRTLLEDDMVAYRKFLSSKFTTLFTGYNPDRVKELSSQMTADDINTGLERLEKVRLHRIDTSNEVVSFLNSIGVRTNKDIELTKRSFNWLPIITDNFSYLSNWKFLSKHCYLNNGMKVKGFPQKGDEVELLKANQLIEKCCQVFKEVISNEINEEDLDPVKVAIATNMIAVGVDIPRLNVMSISGQPKTSAEYIQASSRVGREVPGIVFTLYNQAKNRDRSYYESFKDYHQAYYRNVESTSVTPFSLPALEKTMDTIVIALARARYFKGSDSAIMDSQAEGVVREIGKDLIHRYESIRDTLENSFEEEKLSKSEFISNLVEELIERWKKQGNVKFTSFYDIMKNNKLSEENLASILFMDSKYRDHHLTQEKLFAMTSLRDVDTSSKVKIKSYI